MVQREASLRIGAIAPPFEARDQSQHTVNLQAFRGRWVVLFFYPKDRTMNCTLEACNFRNRQADFERENAVVFGVSRDDVESHEDFARRRRLQFPLLADPKGQIIRDYRAVGWFGRARRMTYVIDPDGHIARIYDRVRSATHAGTVLSDLRALKSKRDEVVPPRTMVSAIAT
jgi:thioredoxin-dependent peroxiredoxin